MLSLDGKANRLATMIRGNLGAAMQGLAVVPLFAGFDLDAADPARPAGSSATTWPAGCTRRHGYDAVGSGSLFARSALKKRYRPGLTADEAVAARGRGAVRRRRRRHRHRRPGPDPPDLPGGHGRHRRGHQPADRRRGRRRSPRPWSPRAWRTRAADAPPAPSPEPTTRRPPPWPCSSTPRPSRSCGTARSTPARASPAAAASWCSSYDGGVLFVAENHSTALHKVSEIYDRIGFAAVGRYNEFENLRAAGVRLADLRGYSYDRRDVTGAGAGQRVRADPRLDLHRADRSRTRWRSASPRWAPPRPRTSCTGSPTTARCRRAPGCRGDGRPGRGDREQHPAGPPRATSRWRPALRLAVRATEHGGRGERRARGRGRNQLEVGGAGPRTVPGGRSAGITGAALTASLAQDVGGEHGRRRGAHRTGVNERFRASPG